MSGGKKLTMPQIPKQTLIAIGLAVGGLFIGLVGYLVAVSPEKGKIGMVDSQIQVARASLITAEQAPAKVKPIPAKAADLFRLTQAMPDTDDMPGLLLAISQLAKSSHVQLQGVAPAADVTGASFSTIPITVNIEGTYKTMMRFLNGMRQSAVVNAAGDSVKVKGRLFVPTAVSVTSIETDSINATISVDAFTYGGTPPPATADTSTDGTTTTAATTTTAD